MTKYEVRTINLVECHTPEEYTEAFAQSPVHYCKGLAEVRAFCGGNLRRERCGYSGVHNNIEYIATRC